MALPAASGDVTKALFPNAQFTNNDDWDATSPVDVSFSGIFIPFSDFESYTAARSGDYTEFVYSVLDRATDYQVELGTDLAPTNLQISRSLDANGLTDASPTVTKSYSVSANLTVSGIEYEVTNEA